MAATNSKVAVIIPSDATTKMAANGNESDSFNFTNSAAYNPSMPPELAAGLPALAEMLMNALQSLRIKIRNDHKEDMDTMFGYVEELAIKTNIIKKRLSFTFGFTRGIPESVEPSELRNYFQNVLNTVKSDITKSEFTLDPIHSLPKQKTIPSSAPRDVMVRIHPYHVKEEFLNKVRASGLPKEFSHLQIFQDFSAHTMNRRS
ncbi:Hypothetical predicted protein [Pelobates cultripes]|uniref:Uncharacterized protein n=1 Tax=Pelobates cultripes TaxID=61616 RepID=A0AAD1T497_PELCU|nr:Hypothetical predicted protein [Pelobates cultripes]